MIAGSIAMTTGTVTKTVPPRTAPAISSGMKILRRETAAGGIAKRPLFAQRRLCL